MELPKSDVINYLQQNCTADFLKKWRLTGSTRLCRKQRNCSVLAAAYKVYTKGVLETSDFISIIIYLYGDIAFFSVYKFILNTVVLLLNAPLK